MTAGSARRVPRTPPGPLTPRKVVLPEGGSGGVGVGVGRGGVGGGGLREVGSGGWGFGLDGRGIGGRGLRRIDRRRVGCGVAHERVSLLSVRWCGGDRW